VTTGSLHILRHTHATLALTKGVPLHVLAARIGDRAETVLANYAHLLPTSDAQTAEQVAPSLAIRLQRRRKGAWLRAFSRTGDFYACA
jgi:integrase